MQNKGNYKIKLNQSEIEGIKRFIMLKVGTNIYINQCNKIKGTNKYEIDLGVSIPKIIYDDKLKKQYIKFLKFNNLSRCIFKIDNKGVFNANIDSKKIYEKVKTKEKRLISNVENIILDDVYPKLIRISLIQNNLRPIYKILNQIFFNKKFTKQDFNNFHKKDRLKLYLEFLEDYDIIRINSKGDYEEGNIPIKIQEALEEKDEINVLEHTFGYVLKDCRKYLREELHLYMLDTFISIITSYYYLSSKMGKIIRIKNETFFDI